MNMLRGVIIFFAPVSWLAAMALPVLLPVSLCVLPVAVVSCITAVTGTIVGCSIFTG